MKQLSGAAKKDLLWGLALGVSATGACVLAAAEAFPSFYYLVWLLASSMAAFLLVAWFLYLRDDKFLSRPSAKNAGTSRPRRIFLTAAGFLFLASLAARLFWGFGARY